MIDKTSLNNMIYHYFMKEREKKMKLFFEEILVRFGFLILEDKNNNKRFKSKMNFIYIPLLFPNSKAKTDHTDRRRRRNIICSKRKK